MAYELTYSLINNDTEYSVTGYTGEPVNVVIPSEYNSKPVTSIGGYAFFSCYSLTSVVIPDSVTSIGYGAFANCDSLTSVEIPDSVTIIGDRAFSSCSGLTSVVIGDSVTSIGEEVFSGCSSLMSVVLGDSVTSIGDLAFGDCNNLTKVTLLAKTPAALPDGDAFTSNPTFYCFSEAIEAYKTTTNWNAFANNFVADDIRLYFTMNSRAQKNYFASKEWVNEQNFGTAIQIITWEEND